MSYSIPTSELSLSDTKTFRGGAVEAGIARGLELRIATNRKELVVLEALPLTNLVGGWTTEQYITPAPAAVGWGWAGDGAAVAVIPIGQIAVFYKCANGSAVVPPVFIATRFQVGAGGASTKGVFHFQLAIENKMESDVYFSEAVVYDPQDNALIQAYSNAAAGAAETLAYGCFIIMKLGAQVS